MPHISIYVCMYIQRHMYIYICVCISVTVYLPKLRGTGALWVGRAAWASPCGGLAPWPPAQTLRLGGLIYGK